MAALGAIAVLIALVSDSCWGLLAGAARRLLRRSPQGLTALTAIGAVAVIGLGARLALTGRHDWPS